MQNLDMPRCVNTEQAARMTGLSPITLEMWRCRGQGPRFLKLGRRVVYRVSDLEQWLESHARGGDER